MCDAVLLSSLAGLNSSDSAAVVLVVVVVEGRGNVMLVSTES